MSRHLFAIAFLALGVAAGTAAQRTDAFVDSRHHPAIAYGRGVIDTPMTTLNERLASGDATLGFDSQTGYLRATLEALDISPDSQVLVYSPTSFQASHIRRENPRAIYFNDRVAVGWIPGADLLEVTAQDPHHGTLFYTVGQAAAEQPRFNRQEQCVSCHLTWDTLGVPGLTVRTTLPRTTPGAFVSGGPVDHRRPMAERWSGWFVTGARVPALHLGNRPLIAPEPTAGPAPVLSTVAGELDATRYLRPTSDIVALLVLEHQIRASNLITWAGWEARLGDPVRTRIAAEALADYLLFVDEAPIEAPIAGDGRFAESFRARGPRDGRGRSLRDFQLDRRLMRFPLSYMIYTPMFDALPEAAAMVVKERLAAILSGREQAIKYAHLSSADRQAVREIVEETKPGLLASESPHE